MMNETAKLIIGFLILVATWEVSAGFVLAADPELTYPQRSQQNTAPPPQSGHSITQDIQSAGRQVDDFKQQTEGCVQQAAALISQTRGIITSLGDWLNVQTNWLGKQWQDLSSTSGGQSTK